MPENNKKIQFTIQNLQINKIYKRKKINTINN